MGCNAIAKMSNGQESIYYSEKVIKRLTRMALKSFFRGQQYDDKGGIAVVILARQWKQMPGIVVAWVIR